VIILLIVVNRRFQRKYCSRPFCS